MAKKITIESIIADLKDNTLAQEIYANTDRSRTVEFLGRIETLHKGQRQTIRQLEAIAWYKEKQFHDEHNAIQKAKGLPKETRVDVANKLGFSKARITQAFGSVTDAQALKDVLTGKQTLSGRPTKDGLEGRPGPKKGQSTKTPVERAIEHVDKLGALILSDKTASHHKDEIKAYVKQELTWVLTGTEVKSEVDKGALESAPETKETVVTT
jgi:hypothetical protein